jgi:hypothetical protein
MVMENGRVFNKSGSKSLMLRIRHPRSESEILHHSFRISSHFHTTTAMAKARKDLEVLPPQPVVEERSPLLGHVDEERLAAEDNLEAQAERERREHDAVATPIADEPSTRKLVLTMASLWLGTFFAALGNS